MADIKLNVKLNRGLYSREACTETQRLMSCYVLAESKHSGKTYLVTARSMKVSLPWSDVVFSLLWYLLIMPIPLNKLICFLLATVGAVGMAIGLRVQRKRYLKKCQFHPLMVFDPQKQTISFYRFKDVAFFQMSGKVQKFKFSDIVRTQLQHTYRLINPNGEDVSIYCRGCVFNIFTRDTVGNQVQNMIFATYDGGGICKKIANLLKEYGNIPIDVQRGSGMDQYR